jgi:hypothetical protein
MPAPHATERDLVARFRTGTAEDSSADGVRIGFAFGPRALRRFLDCPTEVVRATGVGAQRGRMQTFADAASIARFLVTALNGSLRRARIATRVRMGAVAQLDTDETQPFGPFPGAWLVDLFQGHVVAADTALPLECWAGAAGVQCVFVLVDWRIQRGDWAGFAPAPAALAGEQVVFHPVAIADLNAALTAHTLAHEFGHILGCTHEDDPGRVAPYARAYASSCGHTFGVMAAAKPQERRRRLEWSRPHPRGSAWNFGDSTHDEAAWLRTALPQLARQRFTCHGACDGACAPANPALS